MKTARSQPLSVLYASPDEAFAQRIATQLRQVGYEVTTTEAPPDVSSTVLVALSPAALQSPAFAEAWHTVFARHQRIFPLVARACALPPELTLFQWIIFDGREAAAFIDLQRALATDTGKRVLPVSRRALIAGVTAGGIVLALIVGSIIALLLARPPHQIVAVGSPTPSQHGRTQTYPLPTSIGSVDKIVTAADGSLWLIAYLGGKLIHFVPQTGQNTFIALPQNASLGDIVALPDDTLWFIDQHPQESNSIGQLGHIMADGSIQTFPITSDRDQFAVLAVEPHLAIMPDGTIWFPIGDGLGKRAPDGAYHYISVPSAPSTSDLRGVDGDIVAGPDGSIWLNQYGYGGVTRMFPNGQFHNYAFARADLEPHSLVLGSDGTLWCALDDGEIARVLSSGAVSNYHFDRVLDPAYLAIQSLAVTDTNIWFSVQHDEKIIESNIDGTLPHVYTMPSYYFSVVFTVGHDQTIWGAANDHIIHLYP